MPDTTGRKSCPQSPFPSSGLHSTDPRWKPNNHEQELLNFLEVLITDFAERHSDITTRQDIAARLVAVADGVRSSERIFWLAWLRKKVELAKEVIEKFPEIGGPPAKRFLAWVKEKYGEICLDIEPYL